MPSRYIVKKYIAPGYYHLYNRGVEKREIFIDDQDCTVFLHYLKLYLSPVDTLLLLSQSQPKLLRFISLTLEKEIDLLAFTLMPNHFHLEIKQNTAFGIVKLMRRLLTSYVMYFNRKYGRVGVLFQTTYKAILIELESHLLHLSRYIHRNSFGLNHHINFRQFSSYPYYLGYKHTNWVKPNEILNYFKSARSENLRDILSYQSFVEEYVQDDQKVLGEVLLEETE